MTLAWVVGSRGLFGAALCRALARAGTARFEPATRFAWTDRAELSAQMAASVRAFSARAASSGGWEIYWAAGIGTMSTPKAALAAETDALDMLLGRLADDAVLRALPGGVALASSAGAIYGGSSEEVVTETSAVMPTTDYAREKLAQEALVGAFVHAAADLRALNTRLSTLYGAGQAAGKKQGLLSSIARAILRNEPVQIFVPYDTIRDYLHVDDAAERTIAALRNPAGAPVAMRIIAAERPTTVAEIVSVFKRVSRRPPRIVTGASAATTLYARKVRFCSTAAPRPARIVNRSLVVGIAQLLADERAVLVHGRRAALGCGRQDG